jgi:uncharacterized protein YecE (DUF72 family)
MYDTAEPQLYIGTSGLVLPVPNKQAFPEEFRSGSRLTFYASLFNSLEVNSSFYKVPQPATFGKWAHEVPAPFRFTVKLWRGITHEPNLHFTPVDVNKFMHAADQLGSKKGCLLIQLPPALKADRIGQLERLLERVIQSDPQRTWKIAVEFRNKTWYNTEVNTLLTRSQAIRVLHDMPASKIMQTSDDQPVVYLRFHGPAGDYKGGYGEKTLEPYAQMVRKWQEKRKEVYVYFNNTIGDAIIDLNILRTLTTWPAPLTAQPMPRAAHPGHSF